jgi:hypothetical protein
MNFIVHIGRVKMSNDISACNNYNCEMYRFNKCRRAIRHKEAINKREAFVSYIPNIKQRLEKM